MEILKNNDLKALGINATEQTKTLIIGKRKIVLPVYEIPLELLKYNQKNGRIFAEIFNLKTKDSVDLDSLEKKAFNEEIEAIIWNSDIPKNKKTLESIEKYGQNEPGVIMTDGTVIDGNRRFTCLRRLDRENPEKEELKYFSAAILDKEDKKINAKDVRKYELTVQFGQDEKVDYKPLNKSLSIYNDIIEEEITTKEMSDILDESTSSINKRIETIKLVHEFLKFVNAPQDYQLAEKLSIYFALEPLAQYLSRSKRKYSDIELKERKNIYFSYLAGVKFDLPTQTLRDRLIKNIFSEPKYYGKFKEDFHANYANDISRTLSENGDSETNDRYEKILNFRKTDTSDKMKDLFYKTVHKIDLKKNQEVPMDRLRGILEQLEDLNLQPFIEANAESQLVAIKGLLDDVIEKARKIKMDLE